MTDGISEQFPIPSSFNQSWTKTSHESRPVMNQDQSWTNLNLSMHMYGLSIQIGKGLWTRIWIQKFIIVVDLKISIFFKSQPHPQSTYYIESGELRNAMQVQS